MGKKGSLLDLVYIVLFVFFFSFSILIGYKIADAVNTKAQAMSDMSTEGKTAVGKLPGYYSTIMDNGFLFFTIGIAIVTFILAALVRVHPIFIPLYIIGLAFVVFLSAIFSNAYEAFAESSELSSLSANLTLINYIMTYLPFIVGIFGTILMVIMYKTWRAEELYGY